MNKETKINEKIVQLNLRIPLNIKKECYRIAKEKDVNLSQVIRKCLRTFIEKNNH